MYGDYTTTNENTTPVTEVRELENKVAEEEKMLEEKEKRLQAWGCNIDDREMALTQLAKKLEEREEKAVALITEVEKRKKVVEVVERRENKVRDEDILDTTRVSETQRDQRPGTPPVHREQPRPVREGKQGEAEVRQPTAHQLFVGNIPNDVDKAELTEFFEQFGRVQEVIINNVGKLRNFGFVAFDDSEPVQQILSKRPIMFRGNTQLNVEEMKGKKDGRKGVPRVPPTHAQKPSFDSRCGVGQEEEEEKSAATPNPGPSAEAEKAVKPAAMEEEQRLKAWRHNLVDWETALKEMEAKLAEREERAKAKIIEVEKMKQKLLERENKAREKDSLDTLIPETQRDQIPGSPSPVHRGTRPVGEGKQGDSQVRKPTAHQLFVGNVPHDADKTELVEFFEQFGRVLELTIKSRGKQSNFGFVLFDDSEPVQQILSKGNITFRGNWHLNVEEIKTRSSKKAVPWSPPTHAQTSSFDTRQGADQETDEKQQEMEQQEMEQQEMEQQGNEQQEEEKESAVTASPGSLAEAEKVVVKPAAMEEEEKRLKSWGHNLDDWEMALREKEKNLVEREEKAKVMITEVEKRKQKVVERENKAREKDILDTPAIPRTQRDQRPGTPPVHRGPRPVCDGMQGDSEVMKPATHQLFVGKIPHNVEKAELTEFFEQFGRVLELIIIKNDSLPNFGFVMFDDLEPVQQILSNRPIKFRGNCRLNVEEMKPKSATKGVPRSPPTYAQKPSVGSRQDAEPSVEAEDAMKPEAVELKTEPQPETHIAERKPTEKPCLEPGVPAEKFESVAFATPEPLGEAKEEAGTAGFPVVEQKWPSVPRLKKIFEQEKIMGFPQGPSTQAQKRIGSRQGQGQEEEDSHKSPEPSAEAEKVEPAVIKLKSPSVPKIKMFFEQFGQEVHRERKDKCPPRTVPLQ